MNCKDVERLIFLYCDNSLNPQKRLALEEHTGNCPSCRNKLDLAVLENELIKEAADIPRLPESFTDELMQLIESRYSSIPPQGSQDLPMAAAIQENKRFNWGIAQARIAIVAIFLLAFIAVNYSLESRQANTGRVDMVADRISSNTSPVPISGSIKANHSEPEIAKEIELKEDINKSVENNSNDKGETIIAANPADISGYQQNLPMSAASPLEQHPIAPTRIADNNNWVVQEVNRGKSSAGIYDEEPNMLLPCRLPESYQLVGANQGADEYSFSYKKKDNGVELKITIVPNLKREDDSLSAEPYNQKIMAPQTNNIIMFAQDQASYSPADTAMMPVETGAGDTRQQSVNPTPDTPVSSPPLSVEMLNSIKETLLINKNEYQVTISGNLPPEELATVAAVIDWQEGRLTTDNNPPDEE